LTLIIKAWALYEECETAWCRKYVKVMEWKYVFDHFGVQWISKMDTHFTKWSNEPSGVLVSCSSYWKDKF
jgi:hypothetical protein